MKVYNQNNSMRIFKLDIALYNPLELSYVIHRSELIWQIWVLIRSPGFDSEYLIPDISVSKSNAASLEHANWLIVWSAVA